MIILEMYKKFLGSIDLTNINLGEEVLLCGMSIICLVIDAIILICILLILIKIVTKKPIMYWIDKYLENL